MLCRQCNGEKRLLNAAASPPRFVVCPICRGTGESEREPVKPRGVPGVVYETIEAHGERMRAEQNGQ